MRAKLILLLPVIFLLRSCAPPAPVVSPLKITTTSLAPTIVGSRYTEQLGATGGTPPYSWLYVSGEMPPGISLSSSGILSGSLDHSGTYTFVVEVEDSAKPAAIARLELKSKEKK